METWESIHDYDPDYEGPAENFTEVVHGELYTLRNNFYLNRNTEASVTRIVEIQNGDEYDSENLVLTKTNQYDLLEFLPSGQIQPVYSEEED